MRVDAYSAISSTYTSKGKVKTNAVKPSASGDKIEISQFGRDYQIAKQAVKDAPDVREDKIADIKAMMSSGTYSISARDLADKLVSGI